MKKRMLALLLILCMVVSLLPAQAVVAEGTVALSTGAAASIEEGVVSATFTPDTTGTYVFYDTTSSNQGGNEWSIGFPNDGIDAVPNRTYYTDGYRADLQGGTTYSVEVNNQSGRALSLNVAAAVYGGEISFPESIMNQNSNTVGGEWGFEVLPKDPNGVLNNQIGWDNGATNCVTMTRSGEYNQNVNLVFVEEGTFTLTATDRVEGSYTQTCSHTITVVADNQNIEPPTMAIVAEGAPFIVYPVQGDAWSTEYYGVPVAATETLRNYMTGISMPTHQSEPTKKFDGWMACTQDAGTGAYVPIPDTQILGLEEILDYPVSDNYTTYFVAQWRIEEPEPIDLGEISLNTPVTVQIDYFPGQATQAVATFAPEESGYYMICWESGWQTISAKLNDTGINGESCYSNNEEGMRWKMSAGQTYQIVFEGSTNGPITYTMKKVPEPTAIAFYENTFTAYLGDMALGVYDVAFTPAEAYADVEIAYADADFVEKNENDRYIYKKLGTSAVTATCGTLTATAEVTVEEPVSLTLDETLTKNTGSRSWLKYVFTPAESGEYTFDFRADKNISCMVDELNEAHWSVLGGGKHTYAATLEGGKTYTVWAGEASNEDITAKVTKGSDWLTMTEASPLAANIPAKSAITAEFTAAKSGMHILYWPKEVKLGNLEIKVSDTQNGYVGNYYGDEEMLHKTRDAVGLRLDLTANEKYIITLTNAGNAALSFNLGLQPAVTDTEIAFDEMTNVIYAGESVAALVVAVDPAGVLGTISWESSDESVLTAGTGDNTQWGYIEAIAKGKATITATNSSNGEKISHTYTVINPGEPDQNIHMSANGGTISYIGFDGVRYEDAVGYTALLDQGKSLADEGLQMTDADVKYWTDRTLEGWHLFVFDEYGNPTQEGQQYENVLFTTAEVLNFKIPAYQGYRNYQFSAIWSGNDSDYIAYVDFDGRGATLTMANQYGEWPIPGYTYEARIDGTALGTQDDTVVQAVAGEPEWGTCTGWLACRDWNGGFAVLLSTTQYTFAQIAAQPVTESAHYIPKWSNVELEDYEELFSVKMPGEKMTPDTKYDVPVEQETFFSFTAPAYGIYNLSTDAQEGDSELRVNIDGDQPGMIFDGASWPLELEKGQTIQISAYAEQACKMWLEKTNMITKMEVISQDKTPVYLANDFFDPRSTLKDVELKLTFEDGTVIQGNGWELLQEDYGLPIDGFVEKDGDTVFVGWESGKAKVSYQITADKANIIGFEVIPAADMFDIYEGTMCGEENGRFVYEEAVAANAMLASYRFKWDDGKEEVYQPDPDAELYYHGIPLIFRTIYPIGWSAGTYNVPVCFGDLTDDLPVTIKENKVEGIELLSLGVDKYTLGDPDYFVKTEDGWVMENCDISKFKLKVNYLDGTSKILTETDTTIFRDLFGLLDNTVAQWDSDKKVHTAPGKNAIYVAFMGCVDELEVDVVNPAVEDGNIVVPETVVDKALEDVKEGTVTVDVTTDTTDSTANQTTSVKLPVASVEKLVEEEVKQVEIKLDSATVTLDTKTMEAIAEQAAGVAITLYVEAIETKELSQKQQAALQNKQVETVLTALILSNDEPIGNFKGGSVKVRIPFAPESGYSYKVHYVADDGTITPMTTEKGADFIAFWTNHFSDYVVVKEKDAPKPTEPTIPEETTKPTEPAVPEETTKPTEPAVPEETIKPTEPAVPETTVPAETAKPVNPTVPDTGDNSGVTGMMLVMLASGTAAAALWLSLRKRNAV